MLIVIVAVLGFISIVAACSLVGLWMASYDSSRILLDYWYLAAITIVAGFLSYSIARIEDVRINKDEKDKN